MAGIRDPPSAPATATGNCARRSSTRGCPWRRRAGRRLSFFARRPAGGRSPNAAYRHFADRQALLQAVSAAAQATIADRIQQELDRTGATDDAATAARHRLRAIGLGYIGFAREQPGLFRVAFGVPDDITNAAAPSKAGSAGRTPFQLLADALDELVAAGVLPSERRPEAEILAWSAVHGLGMLVIDGPLRGLDDSVMDATAQRLLDMVDRGL